MRCRSDRSRFACASLALVGIASTSASSRVRASIDARAQRVLRVRRAARVRVERARGAGDGAVEALDEGARAVVAHRASRRRARGDATGAPA